MPSTIHDSERERFISIEPSRAGTWRWLAVRYFAECTDYLRFDERTKRVRRSILEATFDEPIAPGSPKCFRDFPLSAPMENMGRPRGIASDADAAENHLTEMPSPIHDRERERFSSILPSRARRSVRYGPIIDEHLDLGLGR